MRHFIQFLMLWLTFTGFLSCKQDNFDKYILSKGETLSIRYPTKALSVLDSIQFPEAMSKEDYRKYLIQMTVVHFALDKDVSRDSLMLDAAEMFEKQEDFQYAAMAEFSLGCINMHQQKLEIATRYMDTASVLAAKTADPALQAMVSLSLGDLKVQCSKTAEAIPYLRKAVHLYHKAGMDYPESAKASTMLAKAFSMIENRDSALSYGYQVCKLAKKHSNVEGEALAMQGIGDLEWHSGHYDQAEKAYLKALSFSGSAANKVRSYVNLAILNYEQNKTVAVKSYVKKMEPELGLVRDPFLLVSVYQFLKEFYKETGSLQKAVDADVRFNNVLSDVITEKRATLDWRESKKIVNLRQSYLKSQMSGRARTWILVISCLLLIAFVLVILRQNRHHRTALLEAKSNITTLQSMASDYQEKEDNLRQLALKHFNVLKRVALLDGMMKDLKSGQEQKIYNLFNQAVYENKLGFDWDTFFQSINHLKNGMPEKVRKNYPQLTETEYRILILSFTGLSNKETSIILNLSVNTINSLRTSIRRKLNVPEYGDLEAFVTNQL